MRPTIDVRLIARNQDANWSNSKEQGDSLYLILSRAPTFVNSAKIQNTSQQQWNYLYNGFPALSLNQSTI